MANPNCDKLGHLTTGTRIMCAECYNKQANAIQRVRELLDYWDGLTESELGFERQIISGLIDAVKYALDGKK